MLGLGRAMADATDILWRRWRRPARRIPTGSAMTGLDGPSFVQFAKLSGLVPVVGVVSGYCFAGNARDARLPVTSSLRPNNAVDRHGRSGH